MKKYYIVLGIALIITGYFFFDDSTIKVPPPKNQVVIAFGDSLIQGVGATVGHDIPALLSQKIGMPVINEGLSGDTTETALHRVDNIIAQNPGVVIVLLGGNDYLRKVPKETTFANLHTILSKLKENDIRVLLLGVRGGLLRDTYEKDFTAFAKKEKVPYISNILDGIIGEVEYMSLDHIHPNDKGYEKMALRITPVLLDILKGK